MQVFSVLIQRTGTFFSSLSDRTSTWRSIMTHIFLNSGLDSCCFLTTVYPVRWATALTSNLVTHQDAEATYFFYAHFTADGLWSMLPDRWLLKKFAAQSQPMCMFCL